MFSNVGFIVHAPVGDTSQNKQNGYLLVYIYIYYIYIIYHPTNDWMAEAAPDSVRVRADIIGHARINV